MAERHRFCPRCDMVTVWDTPDGVAYDCTNWRDGEETHCGFTLDTPLTDAEAQAMERYHQRINPSEPQNHRRDPDLKSAPRYSWV